MLKQKAHPINKVDAAIKKQMDAMLETMYEAPGIGLAANQVNLLNRVLVIDITGREEGEEPNPICMANPEILWESEAKSIMEEGCLSIPKQYAEVERPAEVRVQYLDYEGKEAELSASGLLSHCVQHEIDHLNGILFTDYLSNLKRNMMIKKAQKISKAEVL